MVDICKIVRKGLLIDGNLAGPFGQEHFSLTALPLPVSVVLIDYLLLLFDALEGVLGCFEREELELELRVDGGISHVVPVDLLSVFGEDVEILEILMSVQVEGHLVEAHFQSGCG